MLSNYRTEIEGYRALSIILVFIFHLNNSILPNGFLGVDIFFVISGYVISRSLFVEYINNKKISILDFYCKRFKRLIPALILMLFLTMSIFVLFSFFKNSNFIIQSSIYSLLASSNFFYFFENSNYFTDSENNPFLHTWSLSVEEQYYLFFPIGFFLFLKLFKNFNLFKKKYFFFLLFISNYLVIFLLLNSSNNFSSNYFFPIVHFFKILLGVIIFFMNFYTSSLTVFLFGLLTIILSQLLVHEGVMIVTLLNLLGISFFLLCRNNPIQRAIFENQYIRYLGKISYSFYLIHLPLIYIVFFYFDFNLYTSIIIFFLSLIYSIFSYQLVELKFRYINFNVYINNFFSFFLIISIFFSYILMTNKILTYEKKNQILNNFSDYLYKLNIFNEILSNSKSSYSYEFFNGNSLSYCFDKDHIKEYQNKYCFKENSKDKKYLFFILGNSHSLDLVPAFDNFGIEKDIFVSTIGGSFFSTSLYNNSKSSENIFKNKIDLNSDQLQYFIDLKNNYEKSFIIVEPRYSHYLDLSRYDIYQIDGNKKLNNQLKVFDLIYKDIIKISKKIYPSKIVIIKDRIEPDQSLESCIKKNVFKKHLLKECSFSFEFSDLLINYYSILEKLSETDNIKIISFNELYCQNFTCNFFYDKNKPIFHDKDHLTINFSISMSKYFEKIILN